MNDEAEKYFKLGWIDCHKHIPPLEEEIENLQQRLEAAEKENAQLRKENEEIKGKAVDRYFKDGLKIDDLLKDKELVKFLEGILDGGGWFEFEAGTDGEEKLFVRLARQGHPALVADTLRAAIDAARTGEYIGRTN